VDAADQIVADARDDVCDIDRLRNVMNEVDKNDDAEDGEDQRAVDGEMGNELRSRRRR
jgi:hypothetical protein